MNVISDFSKLTPVEYLCLCKKREKQRKKESMKKKFTYICKIEQLYKIFFYGKHVVKKK